MGKGGVNRRGCEGQEWEGDEGDGKGEWRRWEGRVEEERSRIREIGGRG